MPKQKPMGFEFEDGGRVFTCSVEPMRTSSSAAGPDSWWWFRVSTDASQRYAPFRHEPGDTALSVRPRIVAYYDQLLARRAEPSVSHWSRRGRPPSSGRPAASPAESAAG